MDDLFSTAHATTPTAPGDLDKRSQRATDGNPAPRTDALGLDPTATNPLPGSSSVPHPATVIQQLCAEANATVDALLDAVADLGARADTLDSRDLEWLVREVQTLVNRHDRVRIRALDVVRATREAGNAHHLDDAQFTAGRTRTSARQVGRDADLAKALGNHRPAPRDPAADPQGGRTPGTDATGLGDTPASDGQLDEGQPAHSPTAQAWDAGLINRDQALIITQALESLPDHLTEEQRSRVETGLVSKAQHLSPAKLRRAAKRALAELDLPDVEVDEHHNDVVRAEEQAAWEAASFWMKDNHDGTWFGQFTLPDLQAHMLKKALDTLTSPRRRSSTTDSGTHPGTGGGESGGSLPGTDGADTVGTTGAAAPSAGDGAMGAHGTGDARFDRQLRDQQRGQALAELIDHLPTDKLGSKINAILLVTTDLETLRGEVNRVGITDTGNEVSAAEVRRLASNAGTIPVVMGGDSIPLDLGRQQRFFSDAQRAALAAKYDSCAERDCERPFAWCEIHHDNPWSPRYGPGGQLLHPGGGRTDLSNGIPLCGRHNRLVEHPHYSHTTTRDARGVATITFTRRRQGAAC